HPVVPIGHVPQHARNRPELVGRSGEGLVIQPVDERPQTLALAVVVLDVGAILSHNGLLTTVKILTRQSSATTPRAPERASPRTLAPLLFRILPSPGPETGRPRTDVRSVGSHPGTAHVSATAINAVDSCP